MSIATKLGALAFMLAVDALIWWIIRTYERRGVVLGFPWNTYRDRSPRAFKFRMIMLRLSLALCIGFTVLLTFLLFTVEHA